MVDKKNSPKFDTCFFERYAKLTLETVLGAKYSDLVNRDRPDLQTDDCRIGIEVTRALKESKVEAIKLLNEMAVAEVKSVSPSSREKLIPLRTSVLPKLFLRFVTSNIAIA
mgnify:CR=1 FL=1